MSKIINFLSEYLRDVEFLKPEAILLSLIFIPLVATVIVSYRRDIKILSLLKINSGNLLRNYLLLFVAFLFLFSGVIGMLMQPKLQVYNESIVRVQGDYIFLIDISKSGNAMVNSNSESQLELAKEVVVSLLETLEGSRIQIFAYTSAALPLSDFTTNIEHLQNSLDKLVYTEVIAKPGSNLPNALASIARNKMNDERYKNINQVILISDGQISVRHIKDLSIAMDILKDQRISLTTVGVGSVVGWKIPIFDDETGKFTGEYAKVRGRNKYFVSVLNEKNLQILASFTGGEYFHYEEMDNLRNYVIDKAEQDNGRVYLADKELLGDKDISWIFAPFIVIGLFILVLKRNLI